MEGEGLDDVEHVGSDGANDSQPVGEQVQVRLEEGREGVAVVRPVVLGLAEAVDENEAALVRKFTLTSKQLQRLEDSLDEGLGGVGQAARVGQNLLQLGAGRHQAVEVTHVRVLGELRRDGVDKLRNGAAAFVVQVAEVVADHLPGEDFHAA